MNEKEIHLRDYYRMLLKRRHIVFTIFTLVFIIFLIATFTATPLYIATTKVLIEKNEPANLAALNFYFAPYDPDFYETQYQLINSSSVALRVVKLLNLDQNYESFFKNNIPKSNLFRDTINWFRRIFSVALNVTGGPKPKLADNTTKEEKENEAAAKTHSLASTISGSIIVAPIKSSKLVNISYVSTNPEFAAMVVNTVAKAYMEDILDMKMNSSRHAMRWLTEKADEERLKLEKSEKTLQEYMRNKDIVTLENRVAMVPEKLTDVASKIISVETKRKELEALYLKIKDISQHIENAETVPVIASDPTVQSLRSQILRTEQTINDMTKKFGQKHPAMITALGDLKTLKEKKDQEIRRVIESIRNEYELAKANEEILLKIEARTKAETLNFSEKFVQYSALKRETETNKQLFDAIIKKIKEQGITQDIQTINVWVVEKAGVPSEPYKPRKLMNMLYGLFFGLLGGIGVAFFVEYLDNTVKTSEDAEAKLGVPVLGMVSLLKAGEKNIEDVVIKEPQSVFSESYRVIRTAILLSSAEKPPQNILITSISPGEGKTVTSVNLAVTLSRVEHSVLLIDSDLRKPRVHKLFGIPNTKGLSTYLAGASDKDIITPEVFPNLSVITSGPIPPNPSELLASGRMHTLLKELNTKFDIIIWDSAPLLSVTDSLILSKVLDGTIIVTRAGQTTYENTSRGLKALKDIEAHTLGIIINGFDITKSEYYYKSYNYYYSEDKPGKHS